MIISKEPNGGKNFQISCKNTIHTLHNLLKNGLHPNFFGEFELDSCVANP